MAWLGLDIGGANIKLADGQGYADSQSFALWRNPDGLAQRLRTAIAQAPEADRLVVTMTGELADCFESKEAGVQFILGAVQSAADGRHTRVYLSDGKFVTPTVAQRRAAEAAAANWHALATFATRLTPAGSALMIDVGSTTTDIVPIVDGCVAASAVWDTQRLQAGELVYLGVERTPVCAVTERLPYRGGDCPIARELFATTCDLFLILGDLTEDPASSATADGRPATKAAARKRLGRMICADETSFNHRDAAQIAEAAAAACVERVAAGIQQVADRLDGPPDSVIVAGGGEFLAVRAIRHCRIAAPITSLSRRLGSYVSKSAPAHAVAVLARETLGG